MKSAKKSGQKIQKNLAKHQSEQEVEFTHSIKKIIDAFPEENFVIRIILLKTKMEKKFYNFKNVKFAIR